MHTEQASFFSHFKWHIVVIAVVVIPIVAFAVFGDAAAGAGVMSSALLFCGAVIFLAAILLVMVFSLTLGWFPSQGWTAPIEGFGDFCAHAPPLHRHAHSASPRCLA